MKTVLDGVLALLCGLSAWVCWWFVFMFGFGATGNEAIAVYLIGIPIAACVSLGLGAWRGPRASIPAICIGWALSLVITPAAASLANPANAIAASRLGPALILASILGTGVLGAVSGVRYSRDRNRRHVVMLAVVTVAVTGLIAVAAIRWKL